MSRRLLWLAITLALLGPACSKSQPETAKKTAESLLQPDTGYVFLLEEMPAAHASQTGTNHEPLILIAGRSIRRFSRLDSPATSRMGHLVGLNDAGEVAVYCRDSESPFTFCASTDHFIESFNCGIGISPSGKKAFQIAVGTASTDDETICIARLVEFDTDHRRVMNETSLFEISAEYFEVDKHKIIAGLSSPLTISENGTRIYFQSTEIDAAPSTSAATGADMVSISAPAPIGAEYDYYRYDSEKNETRLWFDPPAHGYSSIEQVDTSRDGNTILYLASEFDGTGTLLIIDDPDEPPNAVVENETGTILRPRISDEGARVAYFHEPPGAAPTQAMVVQVNSKYRGSKLKLDNVSDFCWSDDLKSVAYISNSFRSSLVGDGNVPAYQPGDQWYLHLVEIGSLDDVVVFGGTTGRRLRIIDVVAAAQELLDESDDSSGISDPAKSSDINWGTTPPPRREGKKSGEPGKGPSIDTK
jgi:hypothetical protein